MTSAIITRQLPNGLRNIMQTPMPCPVCLDLYRVNEYREKARGRGKRKRRLVIECAVHGVQYIQFRQIDELLRRHAEKESAT